MTTTLEQLEAVLENARRLVERAEREASAGRVPNPRELGDAAASIRAALKFNQSKGGRK